MSLTTATIQDLYAGLSDRDEIHVRRAPGLPVDLAGLAAYSEAWTRTAGTVACPGGLISERIVCHRSDRPRVIDALTAAGYTCRDEA